MSEVALIRTGVGALVREGTPMLKVVQEEAEANVYGASCGRRVAAGSDRPRGRPHDVGRGIGGRGRCLRRRAAASSMRTVTGWWCATVTTSHGGADRGRGGAGACAASQRQAHRRGSGERQRFASAILPAWSRKSPRVAEVLPLLYLHGLSSSDFAPALEQFLGSGAGLSAKTITRLLGGRA